MKITDLKVVPVNQFLFIKIYTDNGLVGLGESGAWGVLKASGEVALSFRDYLIGKDPLQIETHWKFLYRANNMRGVAVMGAISAIDIALWDIAGKYYDMPIYKLLGGKYRNKIRTYCHIFGETIEKQLEVCQKAIEDGFTALGHISPFCNVPMDTIHDLSYVKCMNNAVDNVYKIREFVGDKIDICIEGHIRFKPSEAIYFADKILDAKPMFYEDPVAPDNIDSIALVAEKSKIPLATGEHLYTLQEFQMLANREAAHYWKPDIALCGGFTGMKKIAAIAEANDVQLAPHQSLSPVNTMALAHFATSCPVYAIQEYADDHRLRLQAAADGRDSFRLDEIVTDTLEISQGYLMTPEKAGIGTELVTDADKKYPFDFYALKMRTCSDGSLLHR